jgi:hypothetical protein
MPPVVRLNWVTTCPVVLMTVTVDVAWAVSTERTMAIGMIQISRKAVVTRSSAYG